MAQRGTACHQCVRTKTKCIPSKTTCVGCASDHRHCSVPDSGTSNCPSSQTPIDEIVDDDEPESEDETIPQVTSQPSRHPTLKVPEAPQLAPIVAPAQARERRLPDLGIRRVPHLAPRVPPTHPPRNVMLYVLGSSPAWIDVQPPTWIDRVPSTDELAQHWDRLHPADSRIRESCSFPTSSMRDE